MKPLSYNQANHKHFPTWAKNNDITLLSDVDAQVCFGNRKITWCFTSNPKVIYKGSGYYSNMMTNIHISYEFTLEPVEGN